MDRIENYLHCSCLSLHDDHYLGQEQVRMAKYGYTQKCSECVNKYPACFVDVRGLFNHLAQMT